MLIFINQCDQIFIHSNLQNRSYNIPNHNPSMQSNITQQTRKQARFYVSTGATLFTAIALYETLKYQTKILQNLKHKKLVDQGVTTKPSQLSTIAKGQLVLVTGTVDTLDKSPINVKINKKSQSLALRLLYKQGMYSNESYDANKRDFHINLREVLKGSDLTYNSKITFNDGSSGVLVKNIDKIDFSNALDIFRWQNNRRNLSLYENLTVFFLAVLRGAATLGIKDPNVTFLKGIQVGTREVEAGIKIGASLTVLGTLGVTTDGMIFIEPSSIFKERLTFLSSLNEKLEELTSKRNFWFAAFVVGAIYVGRRTYKYVKKNNIKMPWEKTAQKTEQF